MAEEKKETDDTSAEQDSTPSKKGWKRFITKKITIIVVAATFTIQAGAYAIYKFIDLRSESKVSNEYSLGHFHFQARTNKNKGVQRAEFDLHIKLLADMNKKGRVYLENNKFKIQQDLQELLRQAAAGDFADPRLVEIKRQLQEQINQTLDKRFIQEVIITDLVVIRAEDATASQKITPPSKSKQPEETKTQWKHPDDETPG